MKSPKFSIFALLLICVLWISIPLVIYKFVGNLQDSALIGDLYGVVNTLFSGLAFALLIYTAWMQKEELELQRNEMRESRKEFAKSAAAQEKQAGFVKNQIEMQLEISRLSFLPYLELGGITFHRSSLNIELTIKNNPLELVEYLILEKENDAFYTEKSVWKQRLIGSMFYPEKVLNITISKFDPDEDHEEEFDLQITYKDVSGTSYFQTLSYIPETDYRNISSPTLV